MPEEALGEPVKNQHAQRPRSNSEAWADAEGQDLAKIGRDFLATIPDDFYWDADPLEYVTGIVGARDEGWAEADARKAEVAELHAEIETRMAELVKLIKNNRELRDEGAKLRAVKTAAEGFLAAVMSGNAPLTLIHARELALREALAILK